MIEFVLVVGVGVVLLVLMGKNAGALLRGIAAGLRSK